MSTTTRGGASPYQQTDLRNLLDLPPDQLASAMASTGAMNAGPPVVHSSHLKNKYTNLVLPWNALLAEQRDIMIPCDKDGNTDPTAWQPTVVEMDDAALQDEQDRLYWQARQSVVEHAMDLEGMYDARVRRGAVMRENPEMTGVMSLDQYYDTAQTVPKDIVGQAPAGRRKRKEA